MRPQEIVDMIVSSDRFAQTHAFEDRVFGDEPILRTGAQAFGRTPVPAGQKRPRSSPMPAAYRKMRALGRKSPARGYPYGASNAKLFYEQGMLMADFEDSFEGTCEFSHYYPTYDAMSDYQLRCYFSWRTRLRHGEFLPAPLSFVYVHVYEILCGIGIEPGQEGHDHLVDLYDVYGDLSSGFEAYLSRWIYDYVVFYGLPNTLLQEYEEDFPFGAVALLQRAQGVLVDKGMDRWPPQSVAGMPKQRDVLDALMSLSRYRAEKSRFIKEHRSEVAQVACNVFAKMVNHCHKRRRVGYMEGLFGGPTGYGYTMFPTAVFWQPHEHDDVVYEVGPEESYVCQDGFWYRELPCRRFDTSQELGNLLHAIDARMRAATDYGHPLKARTLPKYQGKFVDDQVAEFKKRQEAKEAARIRIDRSSLKGIRSAAARTREALLTDDERDERDEREESGVEEVPRDARGFCEPVAGGVPPLPEAASQSEGLLGLTEQQLELLRALLGECPLPSDGGAMFLSLAVDAINEAFLDVVGDTVVEFDGDTPQIVEDYEQDVRDALAAQ